MKVSWGVAEALTLRPGKPVGYLSAGRMQRFAPARTNSANTRHCHLWQGGDPIACDRDDEGGRRLTAFPPPGRTLCCQENRVIIYGCRPVAAAPRARRPDGAPYERMSQPRCAPGSSGRSSSDVATWLDRITWHP